MATVLLKLTWAS